MSLIKKIQNLFLLFGVYVSKRPVKYHYDLENEIKSNLVKNAKGILHIGGHYGQESKIYHDNGLKVIWIEAIPEVYTQLRNNISEYSDQIAYCALLGDKNLEQTEFYLSNKQYSSSSIYKLSASSGFDDLEIRSKIFLPMVTLSELLPNNMLENFDHWVIDVQGAELNVLLGAKKLLKYCFSIQIEVSTREVYINAPKYYDVREFLVKEGFFPLWEPECNSHTDLVFIKLR